MDKLSYPLPPASTAGLKIWWPVLCFLENSNSSCGNGPQLRPSHLHWVWQEACHSTTGWLHRLFFYPSQVCFHVASFCHNHSRHITWAENYLQYTEICTFIPFQTKAAPLYPSRQPSDVYCCFSFCILKIKIVHSFHTYAKRVIKEILRYFRRLDAILLTYVSHS